MSAAQQRLSEIEDVEDESSIRILLRAILFGIMVIHQSSFAQSSGESVVDLICRGISGGTNIKSEYREFEMSVNTSSGEMFNYPNKIALGCVVTPTKGSAKCTVGVARIICDCKPDPLFAEKGYISLSRNTGKLSITTMFKDAIWEGDYTCEVLSKRKF